MSNVIRMFESGFAVTDEYQDGDIHNIQSFKRSVLVHVVNPSSSLTLYYRIYGSLDKENWESEVSEQSLGGSASAAHEITKPWAYLKAQAKIAAWGPVGSCWSHTTEGAGEWIDETDDANSVGVGDVKLPPHSNYHSTRKDSIYYGLSSQFTALKITVAVKKDYPDPPLEWQYWNGSAWTALSDVVDETDASRTQGADLEVNYTLPSDWVAVKVNTDTDALYYIRLWGYGNNSSSAPTATQAWVAVASSTILALINGR